MSGAFWSSWVQPLSETLLQLLWQLGVLGLLAALLLQALRRAPAQWRYGVCAAALMLSLLLAALQLGAQGREAELHLSPGLPVAQGGAAGMPALTPGGRPLAAAAGDADAWQAPTPWRRWLVLAWLGGVALMGLRLLSGLACVARWRAQARPAPAVWQARLEALARRMRVRASVQLKLLEGAGAALAGPFTVGWWRPVVLVPASLLSGLPQPLIEALLAHELAHVRRWDYLANLLQGLVEALLFFHPVIWWLSHRLRTERELVADAIAAAHLGSSRPLALALQAVAEQQAGEAALPQLAAAAQGGELLQRVRVLMGGPAAAARPARSWLPALLMIGGLLAVLWLMPPAGLQQAEAALLGPQTAEPRALSLPADLPLASSQALVIDADSGELLLARDAQRAVPVASISKLMTALVVLQAGQDLQEELRVSREELRGSAHNAASLQPGQRLSREAALTMMLQASDNRAALMLARLYPGGRPAFERDSDALARRLGMQSAQLRHPSGAPASNRASAMDVARLLDAAAREPLIQRAAGTPQSALRVDGQLRSVRHIIPMVGEADGAVVLAKSGFTQQAGRCVALQMRAQGRRLNVVLLGAPDLAARDADLLSIREALHL